MGKLLDQLKPAEKSHFTKLAPLARADLPKMLGIPQEKVSAMTDDEASLRWYAHLRIASNQHAAAVLALSPREAWPELRKLQIALKLMHEKTGTKPNESFDPSSTYLSVWSLKRKIHAMRIIEAVRHHLAVREGQLPASLDEIKDVSIPVDPLTDQPFEWRVGGKTAILKAPPLPADVVVPGTAAANASYLEYELHVK